MPGAALPMRRVCPEIAPEWVTVHVSASFKCKDAFVIEFDHKVFIEQVMLQGTFIATITTD